MGLKVFWTNFAIKELQRIFAYHSEIASIETAKRLIIGIENKTRIITTHPNSGQKEELLKDRIQVFRYLVYKNYKIIYWNNVTKTRIEIIDIFDTRQNPTKILSNK